LIFELKVVSDIKKIAVKSYEWQRPNLKFKLPFYTMLAVNLVNNLNKYSMEKDEASLLNL